MTSNPLAAAFLAAGLLFAGSGTVLGAGEKGPTGKDLAFNNRKGNCLACHEFPRVAEATSLTSKNYTRATIGPPILAMQKRFGTKDKLRAQIYDATVANARTVMPPFGKHKILSDEEIDLITDFIWSL